MAVGGLLQAASPTSYLEWLLNIIIIDPSVGHSSRIATIGDYSHDPHMMRVSQVIELFISFLNYSCIMLLIQFMFHVQIIELENRLS
jgi:hypothetical protein